jgi:hypothetical protein
MESVESIECLESTDSGLNRLGRLNRLTSLPAACSLLPVAPCQLEVQPAASCPLPADVNLFGEGDISLGFFARSAPV